MVQGTPIMQIHLPATQSRQTHSKTDTPNMQIHLPATQS
jgi:hypothetical protein